MALVSGHTHVSTQVHQCVYARERRKGGRGRTYIVKVTGSESYLQNIHQNISYANMYMYMCVCTRVCVTELKALGPTMGLYADR